MRVSLSRLLTALVVTPFASGVVMFVIYLGSRALAPWLFEGTPASAQGSAVALAAGVTVISAVVVVVGAVPAVWWIVRRGPLSLSTAICLGVGLGNAPFAAIVLSIIVVQFSHGAVWSEIPPLWYGVFGAVRAVALGLLIGVSSAAVFWVIGVRGTSWDPNGPAGAAGTKGSPTQA